MTNNIPERCRFDLLEIKKKSYVWTSKIKLKKEFSEIICEQRITMTYDFTRLEVRILEAEQELQKAIYEQKQGLFDPDSEGSEELNESGKIKHLRQDLENANRRIEEAREVHQDFIFTAEVWEHKKKFSDSGIVTEVVFKIEKKVVDWFDKFESDLGNYEMIIVDQQAWNDQKHDLLSAIEKIAMLGSSELDASLKLMGISLDIQKYYGSRRLEVIKKTREELKEYQEKEGIEGTMLQVAIKMCETTTDQHRRALLLSAATAV